jgi:hypothetical protein
LFLFIFGFYRELLTGDGKIEHNGGGQENFVVAGYLEYRDSKIELENDTALEVDMRTAVELGKGNLWLEDFFQ